MVIQVSVRDIEEDLFHHVSAVNALATLRLSDCFLLLYCLRDISGRALEPEAAVAEALEQLTALSGEDLLRPTA
jgi:hypothetical protein